MSRSVSSRGNDILEAINLCFEYQSYLDDSKLESMALNAILMNLSIVGEAVNHLPQDIKTEHSEVRWGAIVGLRNFIVHQYFDIDKQEIFQILDNYLKPLEDTMKMILKEKQAE